MEQKNFLFNVVGNLSKICKIRVKNLKNLKILDFCAKIERKFSKMPKFIKNHEES